MSEAWIHAAVCGSSKEVVHDVHVCCSFPLSRRTRPFLPSPLPLLFQCGVADVTRSECYSCPCYAMAMQVLECILEPSCASKDYFSTKSLLDGLIDVPNLGGCFRLPILVSTRPSIFSRTSSFHHCTQCATVRAVIFILSTSSYMSLAKISLKHLYYHPSSTDPAKTA